jgi:hypothetical protein
MESSSRFGKGFMGFIAMLYVSRFR